MSGPVLAAGKNAGGALLVHTTNAAAFTITMDPCGAIWDAHAPTTCKEIVAEATVGSETDRQLVWCVAAFHPSADPGVTVV
ncbi:MAG: hypothetical protein GF346_09275 [Candidatus Eisenbacteria bacterium]|nr:hypothetical protein [Candidatus Latescibacterota bacterium]MBD3302622.1 hypothetical protein [Candidatus Eisenbacteria bacterium]